MDFSKPKAPLYPLPVARALEAAERACGGDDEAVCHAAVMRLADTLAYYVGSMAVAQYTQALLTGQVEPDPTLSRSLRSLRRVLLGQWLGWAARGLAAAPHGPVAGLAGWYADKQSGDVASAYGGLLGLMREHLAYNGDYGPQDTVSPRTLLELVDQYRIRRGKTPAGALPPDFDRKVTDTLLPGLHAAIDGAAFLAEYALYAPQQRQLLMGPKPATPIPPMQAPAEAAEAATLLLYSPGEEPDYTRRPDQQKQREPLLPLDPLLVYTPCPQCDLHRVAALQEVIAGTPHYLGLDPDCKHRLVPSTEF
ncbi:MAG: hypothetical protein M3390_16545 [Chloroflexota bacterium]|nr:hypothetical protein [Chloroflexota bacterium]